MRGGSDRLPLRCFRLRDQRVTVRAFSGHPSTGRASCSCGTSPVTRKASPSADIDRSDRVSMSPPSALRTDIRPVLRAISGAACRAILRGVGRVYLLNRDTLPLRFVGDEQRELGKAPGIGHAVVFAGGCPTTFACRALAYPLQGFYLDRAHAQGVGMVHDLPGKLVVDSFHPAGLFALAFPDSAKLLCLLQGFTAGVEATAHGPLRAPIAKEARGFAPDMRHCRHFDAQVNSHDRGPRALRGILLRHGEIGDPLAPLFLDAQDPCFPFQGHSSAAETLLLRFAIFADWEDELVTFHSPVLIVPLAMRFFENRETAQLNRAFEDRLGITQCLIFDGAGQGGTEVFGTHFAREHLAIEGSNQDIDCADVLLAVSHQQTALLRGGRESDLSCDRAHRRPCLSIVCALFSTFMVPSLL